MFARIGLALLGWSLVTVAVADDSKQAELAKKPQWQRKLTSEDAKAAGELAGRIRELESTDDYAGALASARELVTLRSSVQGSEHHETITARSSISMLEKMAAQPAEKRRDWREAKRGMNEAVSLLAKAQFAQAEPLFKRYADACRELIGEDHPATAAAYSYLGASLKAQGKSADAQPLFQKALEIYRKSLGEDHPATAAAYYNAASNLNALDQFAQARAFYLAALAIRRKALGEDHPDTASSYNGVAFNLSSQGKYAEADEFLRKALEIKRRVLGENHIDTAMGYNNYAFNLRELGKAAEAAPLLRKSLDITRKVLGENHPKTAQSYSNVASCLHDLGKDDEAQPLLEKSLEIHRKVLGEMHPITAISHLNLATSLHGQGKAAEAQPLCEKALRILRAFHGDAHSDTARAYNGVAVNLVARGRRSEAEPLLLKSLEIHRRVHGENHTSTATSYNNVASNLSSQGKHAEARPLFEKALAIRRGVLGENHPDTALVCSGLASNLFDLGLTAEARDLHERALRIRLRLWGDNHPDTASSYEHLSTVQNALGNRAEAETLSRKALEISRTVLGENHPETATRFHNLAMHLVARKRTDEAVELLRRAIPGYETGRVTGAAGLDRASLDRFNPRLLLAALEGEKDPQRAWIEAERSHARGLLDHGANWMRALEPADLETWTRERSRLAAIRPELLALATKPKPTDVESSRLEKLRTLRRQAENGLSAVMVKASQSEVAGAEKIQASLPADAALLFWIDVENRDGKVREHWACVVRGTGNPKWERLPGTGPEGGWSKDDTLLPFALRLALRVSMSSPQERERLLGKLDDQPNLVRTVQEATSSLESMRVLGARLHAQRIAPVLKHLDGIRTLHVVPDRDMAGVPVEVIAQQFTVSYVPSGTFLARVRDRAKPAGNRLLALGDPIFDTAESKTAKAAKPLPPGGLLVTQVHRDGTAAKANLKPGDVLLKYGDSELSDAESLRKAIVANGTTKAVPVTLWRETDEKPLVREVAPGKLGITFDPNPAPTAIAARRKLDDQLLLLRDGGQWADLPGSRVETNRLAQLFGDTAKILVDGDASEQSLESLSKSDELAKYRFLHFATHGQGNNLQAFEASLILSPPGRPNDLLPRAGAPSIDGRLTAREVLDFWKLDAELVTLSACETATGASGGGDGLLGFAQAFLTAGARSVCLSLWKVDDAATALLMSRFYENLLGKREGLAKPMGKAAALDEGKRWLRNLSGEESLALTAKLSNGVARGTRGKNVTLNVTADAKAPAKDSKPFAHPKYWAAFILIGDPN